MRCPPRISVVPEPVRTAGPLVARLAERAGIRLDEAQRFIADATCGVDGDGRWSAFESVVLCPRQNLKSEYAIVRVLAGLTIFDESLIVYSAHQSRSTTKVFKRLRRAIDRSPELGARIARVSNRIGAESIELTTGQSVECVARSTQTGRGFTGDCIILDESHELDGDSLAALLPMLATRPNPSVLYLLSQGNERSGHLGALRARALDSDPGVCWLEWSMGDDDQVSDERVWAACNPAVPDRISWDYLRKEFRALGEDRFKVERLGYSSWPSGEGEWEIISESAWVAAGQDAPGLLAPVPVLVPAAEPGPFDPFTEWPEGLPPWVRRYD